MNQHQPTDDLQAELEALGRVFEAEEREDRRKDAERRRAGPLSPSETSAPTTGSRTGARLPGTEVPVRDD